MNADDIKPGLYINNFGTTYRIYRIDGDHVVYRIEGIRMKDIRMLLYDFAPLMVRRLED